MCLGNSTHFEKKVFEGKTNKSEEFHQSLYHMELPIHAKEFPLYPAYYMGLLKTLSMK